MTSLNDLTVDGYYTDWFNKWIGTYDDFEDACRGAYFAGHRKGFNDGVAYEKKARQSATEEANVERQDTQTQPSFEPWLHAYPIQPPPG